MNELTIKNVGGLQIVRWNHPSGAFFECIPALGSCMFQLAFNHNGKAVKLFPEFNSVEEFKNAYNNKFVGALLFPYPNRIKQGKYHFNGEEYQLKKAVYSGDNAIHGLVLDKVFNFKVDFYKNKLETEFSFDESQFPGFPFAFSLKNSFHLESKLLEIETSVTNLSTIASPAGLGWHPYFDLKTSFKNLAIQLPQVQNLELNSNQIPSGVFKPFEGFSELKTIGNFPFDHSFKLCDSEKYRTTKLQGPNINISIDQKASESGYKYLQVYSFQEKSWLAIEPMSCAPDSLNNKLGLDLYNPQEERKYKMRINLD